MWFLLSLSLSLCFWNQLCSVEAVGTDAFWQWCLMEENKLKGTDVLGAKVSGIQVWCIHTSYTRGMMIHMHLLPKPLEPNPYPLRRCLTAVLSLQHFCFLSCQQCVPSRMLWWMGTNCVERRRLVNVPSEYPLQRACGECSHARQKDWKKP